MAFGTSSKIFSAFITDALNRTNAFDLNSDSFKVALFNNSITPDQNAASANTAFNAGQWANTNELSNGGWSAGGLTLANQTSTFSSAVYTFDADDRANSSSATISSTHGCLVYDDTLASVVVDQGVSYHAFGGANSVTSGTLTVQWHASGILTLTL
jgi:hypothetical protein